MFDIHIFTLYSLNQTILKEVGKKKKKTKKKEREKVRDTVLEGYKMLFLHISSQRINMLERGQPLQHFAPEPCVPVPAPSGPRLPLDPTASMGEMGKEHLTHSYHFTNTGERRSRRGKNHIFST